MSIRDEIEDELRKVLTPEAVPHWWNTPVPAFNGRTPELILGSGMGRTLLAYVKSYSDPSFT